MSTTRSNRYQEGSIDRVARAKGPDVWVYRWREIQDDGRRVQRKKTIGDVNRYPIESPVVRVMVATAAASALRRSEIRGLRWSDLDFDKLWFNLRRGLVHKDETKLKTKASRKGVPMMPELAEMLQVWRTQTPYPKDNDWVFASPFTQGERPYWPDSVLNNHVRPAATAAGITKTIGWHTFRHSVGSHLGQSGENVKVVQELLRHASSRITQDVYQQADQGAKRTALGRFSGVLAFPAKKTA
jgi:integrase